MNVESIQQNGIQIAVVHCEEPVIVDVDSALDFMMSVKYQTWCARIAVPAIAFTEEFFILSTGLAGAILQKFTTYQIKVGIYGDFSTYTTSSKPLRDFIYESNNGHDVFFVGTEQEALEHLSK